MTTLPLALLLALAAFVALPHAYAHGIGTETIRVQAGDTELRVSIDIPSFNDVADEREIVLTSTDADGNVHDATYALVIYRNGDTLLQGTFRSTDGSLRLLAQSSDSPVTIQGERDGQAWHSDIVVDGLPMWPALYTFDVMVAAVDGRPAMSDTYTADISIVDTADFQVDSVWFQTKSYFDGIDSFSYDAERRAVAMHMPFDWSETKITHIPVIHTEVHVPKEFGDFFTPGYAAKVNGIEVFKNSFVIDDYTESDTRILHFVLLGDQIRHLKNQLRQSGDLDGMLFTIEAAETADFPVYAWTADETLRVDLSWEPPEIAPGNRTKFIITIRDALTLEPLRNSEYEAVILQDGVELLRQRSVAQIGGDHFDYTFEKTGNTAVRLENIRDTGQAVEFGIVVVPEFGAVAAAVLAAGMVVAVTMRGRR